MSTSVAANTDDTLATAEGRGSVTYFLLMQTVSGRLGRMNGFTKCVTLTMKAAVYDLSAANRTTKVSRTLTTRTTVLPDVNQVVLN